MNSSAGGRDRHVEPGIVDLRVGLDELVVELADHRRRAVDVAVLGVDLVVAEALVVAPPRDRGAVGERVAEGLLPLALGEHEVGAVVGVGVDHVVDDVELRQAAARAGIAREGAERAAGQQVGVAAPDGGEVLIVVVLLRSRPTRGRTRCRRRRRCRARRCRLARLALGGARPPSALPAERQRSGAARG